MKKSICLFLSLVLMVSLLTACGVKDPVVTENGSSEIEVEDVVDGVIKQSGDSIDNKSSLNNQKVFDFLNSFVHDLSNNELDLNILSYFEVYANTPTTMDDVTVLFKKLELDHMLGCNPKDVSIVDYGFSEEDPSSCAVLLDYNGKKSRDLYIIENYDKELKIVLASYMVSDFYTTVPTLGEVKLNGVVLSEDYIYEQTNTETTYYFENIFKKNHTYTYNNNILGEVNVVFGASVTSPVITTAYNIQEEDVVDILPQIQELWNNIVSTSIANNGDVSSIRKYFSSSFDESRLNTYATDLHKYLDFEKDVVPVMTDIAMIDSKPSKITSDNAITVTIKYKVTFQESYFGTQETSGVCQVGLLKENDTFVIYGATGGFLDQKFNKFNDDWETY